MSAPRSVLAGLIGAGIQASRTPALHEREGDAQGIRYLYRLIDLDPLGKSADDLEFLLAAASDLGFRTLDGGTMAVFQAVKAFELFSGVTADAARMQAHFASLGD